MGRGRRETTGLEPLFAAVETLVPGVPGSIGAPGRDAIVPGRDNQATLVRLVEGVRRAQPGAGPLFWSVRSWSLLEWQPAALAVLGVHVAGLVPQLDRMALKVGDGDRFGYSFPTAEAANGGTSALIAVAGARLRGLADMLIADLDAVIPLKRGLALRLLADRVLGLLALLSARRQDFPVDQVLDVGNAWLAAMSLEGASRLVPLTLADGREQPVLERRSCCLEYRAEGGLCCPTCPRLAPAEREARMRSHWEAHVQTQ